MLSKLDENDKYLWYGYDIGRTKKGDVDSCPPFSDISCPSCSDLVECNCLSSFDQVECNCPSCSDQLECNCPSFPEQADCTPISYPSVVVPEPKEITKTDKTTTIIIGIVFGIIIVILACVVGFLIWRNKSQNKSFN